MNEPLVLTSDIGTQSARTLLVDKHGNIIDVCQKKYDEPYYSKNPGWAEQRPDFYFDHLCETAKVICSCNKEKLPDVIAMTITVIRDTVLCLDSDNNPLRDIILWLDKRRADFNDPFPLWKKAAFKLVGMSNATKVIYRASFCNWVEQNEPEIWKKTSKYVMLPTYLNYKLTGKLTDTAANMIGHFPLDYKNREWMGKNGLTRCVCDVPAEKLPELKKTGDIIGTITKEISDLTGIPEGLPLIGTGSDKGCETLGLSVSTPEKAAIAFGTTATIQMAVEKYFEPQKFMPAYPAVPNHLYNPEIQIYRGFWLLSWFVKEFGAEDRLEAEKLGTSPEALLDERIKRIPAGCEGLVLQPYWTAGVINPYSLGSVIGFSDFHTRYHFYRSIIEGLCYELYESLKLMEKRSGNEIKEIYIGGGGAKSDIVCQIAADMFGLPTKRIQTHEACSIGSSMVAFVAKKEFDSYEAAIKSMVHEKDVFLPDEKNHELYMELYNKAYKKIFPKLTGIYRQIIKTYKR